VPPTPGPSRATSVGPDGRRFATQVAAPDKPGQSVLLVRAAVPPMGYATVELRDDARATEPPVTAKTTATAGGPGGDDFRVEFDPAKGGTIKSLVAKRAGDREFVDAAGDRRFNELRGHFYDQGGFRSSADQPVTVRVVEDGPLRATAEIAGTVGGHPF